MSRLVSTAHLVVGAAHASIGSECVRSLRRLGDRKPILALDRNPEGQLSRLPRVFSSAVNLNPFDHREGFGAYVRRLRGTTAELLEMASVTSITSLLYAAGVYHSGSAKQHGEKERSEILGVNICGMFECVQCVSLSNGKCDPGTASGLTFLNLGSLHGLDPGANRTWYGPSKAIGLDLCIALHKSGAIWRNIYIAAGPTDSYMLHRNHWSVKLGGPEDLLAHVRNNHRECYEDVFVNCSENAFARVCEDLEGRVGREDLLSLFRQYCKLRNKAREAAEGVLTRQQLAGILARMMLDDRTYQSGLYRITAPEGETDIQHFRFDECLRP